ncbi:MAG: hypothetical protein HON68_08815 [Gammaproteobacteria bacterium]|jgi:phosphotransferase system HPr-like phosphotransfer protein|nr:hypothetical protein [Gammaproteobacteria bacterium]MBT3490137.1 hypothetical protein [Gammaproteobacteria bacterium]MBT3717662.1 hypothetical protein [Gammaproteobacteria bacterium]MBT3845260.1 hypothetical protein [Gammaproteobacteria bacterium]MBT3892368.1 hypothetical protein [Gammaproteobacteria bacterium]
MNRSPNFSKNPGCWEQQLIRKFKNPLFPDGERDVVHHQVVEAREKDKAEQQTFHKQFETVVAKVSKLPEKAEAEQLMELISEMANCYNDCMTLCIDLPKEKQALSRLLTLFEETLLRHAGEESAFIEQIERDRAERKIHKEILENRLIASMMRENSPISVDDLPATLLSTQPQEVQSLLPFLAVEQLGSLQQQMATILEGAKQSSEQIEDAAFEIFELIRKESEADHG